MKKTIKPKDVKPTNPRKSGGIQHARNLADDAKQKIQNIFIIFHLDQTKIKARKI